MVGLFDWGTNTDLTTHPYSAIEDPLAPRTHTVDLSKLHIDGPRDAWEFWTGNYLGRIDGTLSVDTRGTG